MLRRFAGPSAGAAALLGLVLLAGCGSEDGAAADGPGPTTEPTSDPPSTPALPTPPEPLAPPAPADPASESGKAFAARFQAELLVMQATGDSAAFQELYSECPSCDTLVQEVEATYAAGGDIAPGEATVSGVTQVAGDDDVKIYDYAVRSGPGLLTEASGQDAQAVPQATTYYQLSLKRGADDGWTVVKVLSEV